MSSNETKNIENKTEGNNKKASIKKRNSLVENNSLAKWVNDILMKKMDEYAYLRSMMALVILAFFLGNSLGVYLSLYVFFTIYLFALRIVRAWVKRWLLYLLEFCYYGCFSVVVYIIFFPNNKIVWSAVYICSTGVLTWAAFIFQNQARMDNSDHLISSYIHSFPMITVWAIRWKSVLYNLHLEKFVKYNLINFENLTFENEENFIYLIICPIIFWIFWAAFYYISAKYFWEYFQNPKYYSGLIDFKNTVIKKVPKLYGNEENMLIEKYLITHFILYTTVMPISLLCYYSFYFNTFFLISTLTFLAWNAGRASRRAMERMLQKIDNGMNEKKTE